MMLWTSVKSGSAAIRVIAYVSVLSCYVPSSLSLLSLNDWNIDFLIILN
jgi:hypothetical protein